MICFLDNEWYLLHCLRSIPSQQPIILCLSSHELSLTVDFPWNRHHYHPCSVSLTLAKLSASEIYQNCQYRHLCPKKRNIPKIVIYEWIDSQRRAWNHAIEFFQQIPFLPSLQEVLLESEQCGASKWVSEHIRKLMSGHSSTLRADFTQFLPQIEYA